MSELGAQPTEYETIRGVTTDIVLINPDGKLDEYLHRAVGYQGLYRTPPEALPYPIQEATLNYCRHDNDEIDIYATLEFDPESTINGTSENWQSILRTKMAATLLDLQKETYSLSHQPYDFYAKINDIYSAHVQFGADTDVCHVSVSLVSLEKLEAAPNNETYFDLDDNDTKVVPSVVETLREFAAVWSLAIDTVSIELGLVNAESKPKASIVLGAPEKDDEPDFTPGKSLAVIFDEPKPEVYDPLEQEVRPNGFNAIGGLTHAKNQLKELVEIYKDPIGARIYDVKAWPFLLHGPPGTGKSTLGKAVAEELGADFKLISSTDVMEKWVGSSGKNIKRFFNELIKESSDSLVVAFFDEFEALAIKGHVSSQERLDVKKQLNLGIDNIVANHPNIILGAAINTDLDDLEPTLIRSGRFKPVGAPAPNEEERVDVWAAVLSQSMTSFGDFNRDASRVTGGDEKPILSFVPYEDDIDPIELAKVTPEMTGADFKAMLQNARRRHFIHYRQTGELLKVSQADLLYEVKTFGR